MRVPTLIAGIAAFGIGLAAFGATDRSEAPPAPAPTVDSLTRLAAEELRRGRESNDPAAPGRAEAAVRRALKIDPDHPVALIQASNIAAIGHDFPRALDLARAARRAAPEMLGSYSVLVDALVESGRLDEAERELQVLVDRKPSSGAYARASYLRELRGDLRGAAAAMRLAVSAGGETPEQAATLHTLLGNLELRRGRLRAAEREYRAALARFPALPPAEEGLARLAAARGDDQEAVRRFRALAARLPELDHLVMLGEAELAVRRVDAARRAFADVERRRKLLPGGGAGEEPELAGFEADHGDPARALRYARIAHARGHRLESADALGWALTRSGRPREGLDWSLRAVSLKQADPLPRLHAGIAARDAGRPALARAQLRAALRGRAALGPLRAAQAERILDEVR